MDVQCTTCNSYLILLEREYGDSSDTSRCHCLVCDIAYFVDDGVVGAIFFEGDAIDE